MGISKWVPMFLVLLVSCESPVLEAGSKDPVHVMTSEDCFSKIDLCTKLDWQSGPSTNGKSQLQLYFFEPQGEKSLLLPEGIEMKVYLWMPHHGHGSSPVSISESDDSYLIDDVYFIMPGHWDLHIEIYENGELLDAIKTPVSL